MALRSFYGLLSIPVVCAFTEGAWLLNTKKKRRPAIWFSRDSLMRSRTMRTSLGAAVELRA
jgi:hypothetical protein